MSAKPFFIVSSGRSGTAMLHKLLSTFDAVEMHHEYAVQIVQPLAVRRYLGLCDAQAARAVLDESFGAALAYTTANAWGDSSNKLSWLIPDLAALFPDARFVHLVRDGRKVAGSYYRKLGAECYDDRSTALLQAFYDAAQPLRPPPPEKKYWWPVPRRGAADAQPFRLYSQFERMAWHWGEVNRVILQALAQLPAQQKLFVRLEDLRASPDTLKALLHFLNLPYRDQDFALLQRPHNVNRPQDSLLSPAQSDAFDRIAGTMMTTLGYAGRGEYLTRY